MKVNITFLKNAIFFTQVHISRDIVTDEIQQPTAVYSTKVLLGKDEVSQPVLVICNPL